MDGEMPEENVVETATQDEWEPERAKALIAKLRERDKEATKLEKRLAAIEKAEQEREKVRLAEEGKWKELAEKREQELATEKAERKRVELEAARRIIGLNHGLPDALAARLQGETPEEIEADAQALLPLIATEQRKPAPDIGAGTLPATKKQRPLWEEVFTSEQVAEYQRRGWNLEELAKYATPRRR